MAGTEAARAGDGARVPALTFVSTAYRTEDVVERMIRSVLAQTRGDWELVVVDNGPSEAMAEIVGRYLADPRIRLIRQENAGVVGGIHAGAAAARGAIISLLNSDDQVGPRFAERVLAEFEADPTLDAVCPDAHLVLEPGGIPMDQRFAQGNPRLADPRPVTLAELIEGLLPYYGGGIRRTVWEQLGGYQPLDGVEDRHFWLEVVLAGGRIRLLDEALAVYGVDAGSASHGREKVVELERRREALIVDAARRSSRPEDEAALAVGLRESRHRRALAAAQVALAAGDAPLARTAAREALRHRRDLRTVVVAGALALSPRAVLTGLRVRERAEPYARGLRHRVTERVARRRT